MKKALFLLIMLCSMAAQAQLVQLNNGAQDKQLFLNLDRIYDFNIYEHSRWGLGLAYEQNIGSKFHAPRLVTDAYAAYGVQDQRVKYGLRTGLQLKGKHLSRFSLGWSDDLEQAAMRRMESYQLLNVSGNSSYLAMQFSHVRRAQAQYSAKIGANTKLSATFQYSKERYLFNRTGLLYSWLDDYQEMPEINFFEGKIGLNIAEMIKADLTIGEANWEYDWYEGEPIHTIHDLLFIRLIAQYNQTFDLGSNFKAEIFSQAGLSSLDIPYSRMFDLGGSGGSHYYFRNTPMTVRPNQFVAQNMALLCTSLSRKAPWWNNQISKPLPFAQIIAIWGCQWYQDDQVMSLKANTFVAGGNPSLDEIALHAPQQGLLEVALGINRILLWQGINLNIAAAYQITPASAPYHKVGWDNLDLLIGAAIYL